MRRRSFLTALGITSMAGIAGCFGGADEGIGSGETTTSTSVTTTTTGAATTTSTVPSDTVTSTITTASGTTSTTTTRTTTTTRSTTTTTTPPPTPAPDGESYEFSGSGQTATDAIDLADGLVTVSLSHDGDRNFIVQLVPSGAGRKKYLSNVIGPFDGQVATYTGAGEWFLDVDASGDWSVQIHQPRYSMPEVTSLPIEKTETSFDVLGPYRFTGATRLHMDAETEQNVIVSLLNVFGELVQIPFNKIGPFEGETVLNVTGAGLLFVETQRKWTLTVEPA